ncbi:GTP 3',8-cyclase MoaA [Carnimonas nigrificans]|uniref:GTP 3',8-cyclase MoaA n=1 Tax=Carnimonas nigrificans TaxID=64323 RepID=UPI00046F2381|nr:GTP 3',8-cyclase MoaA [Carnimonas nigrificans]
MEREASESASSELVDTFGRKIRYLRLSITDRCDFRCVYCMSEEMSFLPRQQLLSIEELLLVARRFVALGVEKIRITGGEPLVRQGLATLMHGLGALKQHGLKELAITTNGSQLPRHAVMLKEAGVDRLNISLDSLKPERFSKLTRTGRLEQVIAGIEAAQAAGFTAIKLNAVVLRGRNDDEVLDLVEFARERNLDISFIEEMPLGDVSDHGRGETYFSSDDVQAAIETRYPLWPTAQSTLGPSRYFRMHGSATRVGFISPHSHNFCASCNRVRVTAEGRLLLCLGNEHSKDLRAVLRRYPGDGQRLEQSMKEAMQLKPWQHHFTTDGDVQVVRFMNMTGG